MFKNKEEFKFEFSRRIIESYGRTVEEAHITERFLVLETMVRDYASVNWATSKAIIRNNYQKQMHYFSMEFLMGRLLVNNMMNLGIYQIAKDGLEEYGINIHDLEELETDAGLGNGGLGRLAACFMDSLASLAYPGHGHTIRYEYGLFKQKIENGYQVEVPDQWLKLGNMWEVRKPKHAVDVKFWGRVVWNEETGKWDHIDAECVKAVPYDMPIVGNDTTVTNTLRLWSSEPSDEIPSNKDFRQYAQEVRDICQTLYPDDSTLAGRTLRLKQQYFFVSAGLRAIIKNHLRVYPSLSNFHEKNVIQLNDTHPVLVIPELMRILIDEYDMDWDEAWHITTQTCAYTNHTILAEALEKWPLDYLNEVVPQLVPIIEKLDAKAKEKYKDESVAIIDSQDRVHMAHMDIHYGFSVNGVAALHTDILKNSELKAFYQIYPEKFNNKTNGITFRRWLMHCNLELSEYISSLIGDSWKKDSSKLEKLLEYQNDTKVLNHFLKIKQKNKQKLCMHLKEKQDLDIDPNSIFDIQIKRLHEYKRQQLNALYAIYKYKQIKSGQLPQRPITMIFGAKAAPAYTLAKDIIHLILCLQKLTLSDSEVSPYLKVIMVENYNVTEASHLIPACDISEQISLASKEASGTGNMKFMLNGAVTLGTMDGANVEICNLVGKDNIYIFGKSSQEVIQLYETSGYHSDQYYDNDPLIQNLVDFIISKEMIRIGDPENLCRLYKDLISKDWFMTLLDLKEYIAVKENVMADYEDRMNWAGKMLINTAKAGYFSSDRTIAEYNRDIWKL